MQVMNGVEPCAANFFGALQMMQVGPTKMAASIACAVFIKGAQIITKTSIANFYIPVARKEPTITRITCGEHAVKHIDPVTNSLDQIFWCAYAH